MRVKIRSLSDPFQCLTHDVLIIEMSTISENVYPIYTLVPEIKQFHAVLGSL